MTHDQAADLRQLVKRFPRPGNHLAAPPHLLALSGGKGGVGATTLAVNLAVALARQGRRTMLVDADLEKPGVAHLCQTSQQGSILDVLTGRRSIHEVLELGPAGIQVLPGAWGADRVPDFSALAQQRFIDELKSLGLHADVVVIDLGSGRNAFVRRFWQSCDSLLLVTTPDASTIMDSYAAIKVLWSADVKAPVQTVVNFVADSEGANGVHERIAEASRRFLGLNTTPAGHVPTDSTASDAETIGRPFLVHSPRCDGARAVERIAEAQWAQLDSGGSRARAA